MNRSNDQPHNFNNTHHQHNIFDYQVISKIPSLVEQIITKEQYRKMRGIGEVISILLAATSSRQSHRDVLFTQWCNSIGIETPLSMLRTTEESVAGRGVFATSNVKEGDVVMRIPEETVLNDKNAELYFPQTADFLQKRRKQIMKKEKRRQRWWYQKLFLNRRRKDGEYDDFEFITVDEDLWQMELTLYALDILVRRENGCFGFILYTCILITYI